MWGQSHAIGFDYFLMFVSVCTSACVPPSGTEDAVKECVAVETVSSSDTAELCDVLKASVLCSRAEVPWDILSAHGECPSVPNQLKEICQRLQNSAWPAVLGLVLLKVVMQHRQFFYSTFLKQKTVSIKGKRNSDENICLFLGRELGIQFT